MKSLRYLLSIVCATLLFASCSEDKIAPLPDWWYDQTGDEEVYPEPVAADNLVVAHRGAWKEYGFPSNTMAAFDKAIALKCYAAECDIHITKDGKVIVMHDDTFCGLTIKDATYDELCAAGKLANGETVFLFETLVDKIVAGGCTKLWVDVKTMDAAYGGDEYSIKAGVAAANIVREKKAKNFVEFIIGRIAVYKGVIGSVRHEWPVGYMNYAYSPDQFVANGIEWANFEISSVYNNAAKIKTYTDAGIRMSIYQVDSDEQRAWFLTLKNVYGTTNYPKKLLDVCGVIR